MFASYKWLNDYAKVPDSVDINKFSQAMTRSGTIVEGYEKRDHGIENVVTGKVLEIVRHPDSDHMWVTKIDDGSGKTLTIVTGAQNVSLGDIVPVARDHSVIAGDKKIVTSTLRGVTSEGMLCSAAELGISSSIAPKNSSEGIYILPEDTPLGSDIKEVLGLDDIIVEFELTNNRQDCNSILGAAAEVAATFGTKFVYPDYYLPTEGEEIHKYVTIEVKNFELCRRYTARMLRIKKVAPSPMWLQIRLMSSGVRPINNVVDASNFVMLETGQPLHTFDYAKLEGGKIVVDTAAEGDTIFTLDGVERKLTSDNLMINDGKKHIGIAGVMGGLNSDIDDNTELILIEAANFNKASIKNTAKQFGLRTEASAHFEKGISMHLTRYAADRCASLLVELGAAEYIDGIIDVYDHLDEQKRVSMDCDWFNKFIGIDLTYAEIAKYLDRLGMEPQLDGHIVTVTCPLFRQDIEIPEDVAEEAARMFGYDNIPCTMMEGFNYTSEPNKIYNAKQRIKSLAISAGGSELLTYTFISPTAHAQMGFAEGDVRAHAAVIKNPLGEENSVMRTTMLPSMLDCLSHNYKRKYQPTLLFEVGGVFFADIDFENGLYKQTEHLSLGKFGSDFYEIKGVVDYIFGALKIGTPKYIRADEAALHPGRSAYIILNGEKLGYVGQVHPRLAAEYGLPENVVVAEIDCDRLIELSLAVIIKAAPIARFPIVQRDLALIVSEDMLAGEVAELIMQNGGEYIISCDIFDVFRGEALPFGFKSLAFNLKFRKNDATLTDEEIEAAVAGILAALETHAIKLRMF